MVAAAMSAIALAAISAGFCGWPAVSETAEDCVLKSSIPAIRFAQCLVSRVQGPVEAARNHIRAG
jgi:hypothetical protein